MTKYSVEVSRESNDPAISGRSDALTGQRYDVYLFIKMHPKCTRRVVARGLGLISSTATARIKELIDEGFVIEPPEKIISPYTGILVGTLIASTESASVPQRDQVRIEVVLTLDVNGRYGATAYVVDGLRQQLSPPPKAIVTRKITLKSPMVIGDIDTVTANSDGAVPLTKWQIAEGSEDIIDADYTTIE